MAWAIGDNLRNGEYKIESELGNGRFITYRANHKDGSLVVIKVLNDHLLQSLSPEDRQKMKETFSQEAVKLAKCKNRYITKVGLPFIEDDKEFIVMQYINGRSLAERTDRQLSEDVALRYIKQIGEALMVVHENDLTHRNVQPKNILLESRNGNDEAILISFSLAVEQNQNIEVKTQDAAEGFAPPELYSRFGGEIGVQTDIYSLAATLYDLLTGVQPKGVIERRTSKPDPLPAPIGYNTAISDITNQAIMKGMALSPKDRPSTMKDWLISLGLEVNIHTQEIPTPKQSNNWWGKLSFENKIKVVTAVIATAAAIGGIIGGIGTLLNSMKNTPPTPSNSPISVPSKIP
jgi:eukaryotic-like serine/threonine-protein kinase